MAADRDCAGCRDAARLNWRGSGFGDCVQWRAIAIVGAEAEIFAVAQPVFHLFFKCAISLRAPTLARLAGSMNPPLENVPLENLLGLFLNIQYLVEDAIGYVEFIELGERELAAVAEKEGDDVGVGVEAGAGLGDVVGDDHVCCFALELAAGVFGDVVCFGGEAYEDAIELFRGLVRRECRGWVRARE